MSYIKFIFFVCTVQMIILYVIKVYWMSQTGLRLCACVLLTHHHITEHTGCIGNGVPWLLIVMVKVFIMYDVIMLWHLFKLMEGPNALHNRIWVIRHAWCEKTDKWKLQRVCVWRNMSLDTRSFTFYTSFYTTSTHLLQNWKHVSLTKKTSPIMMWTVASSFPLPF